MAYPLLKQRENQGTKNWIGSAFHRNDLQIDIVVGHGVKLGKQAQVIRNYSQMQVDSSGTHRPRETRNVQML